MIKKTTLSLVRFILFFSIFLFTKTSLFAQPIIVPQQFDGLEKLCAGNSFNEFKASFTYLNFPPETTFVLELSDASGSFTNPVATTILQTTDDSATQQTIKFAVPNNLIGSDTYSLRVKASTGYVSPTRFKNSLGNTSFPAFYKDYENSFFINNKIETAFICSGGSLTLSVLNETSSPVNFANIKYKWYKDDVVIQGQNSKDLIINSVGKYYAEIDYGLCSDVNFSSNRVTVSSSASGSAVNIDSSLGNPFCYNGTGTVLSATGGGNSYVWKKDGAIITGVNTRTYSAHESGIYTVEVDFGGCNATGSINLSSNSFNASIDVADEIEIEEGETVNVTVTDDATNPTYEWYLNGKVISEATANTYLVAVKGNYRVKISQAAGCISSKELSFEVECSDCPPPTNVVIPNLISPNEDGFNDNWVLPDKYLTPDTVITIISSTGDIKTYSGNYSNNTPWPIGDSKATSALNFKNVNPVYYYVIKKGNEEKKGSITVIK